jgi:CheY-like chemotaxis protein
MGGKITVESVYGEGSTFTVTIPQKVADKTPVSAVIFRKNTAESKKEGSFFAPAASVLAVDDNKENLELLRLLLSRTMIKLDTAKSGEECIEAVRANSYNAIIMDYMMPGQSGIDTLQKLREIPGFSTPVIALTANVSAEADEKLKAAGFALCLSKPIVTRELEDALKKTIPGELITPYTPKDTADNAPTNREAVKALEHFGVSQSDGLAFLSGDSEKYKKIAELFIENSEPCRKTIENLANKNDFEQLLYEAHSLKSKARTIGANELSDTAKKLESLCAVKNEQHIKLLMPVLFYEWERAIKGLTEFLKTDEAEKPKTAPNEKTEKLSGTADPRDLMPLLGRNRQLDALELVEKLIAAETSPEKEAALIKIREKINDVEFREAEKLLNNLMGEVSDERKKSYSYS